MTEKKLSRRDALKILGAAIGGVALSTIPPKWSKPALAASQLPGHARQSTHTAISGTCGPDEALIPIGNGISRTFSLTLSPAIGNFLIYYRLMPNLSSSNVQNVSIAGVGPVPDVPFYNYSYYNSAITNGSGIAQVAVTFDFVSPGDVELRCDFYWDSGHASYICSQSLTSMSN